MTEKTKMIAPREAYGEALVELGGKNPDVVVLDGDVANSSRTSLFRDTFPDRFYQVGIAEQNMFCIAAGMTTMGFVPFACTFAVFASKRACDQVSISIAYPKLNVKISGAYGGIPTGRAGATHQAVQDVAIMRAMPNMTVISPADAYETKQAVFASAEFEGPVYLRTLRCECPVLFDEGHDFQIGKGYILRQGKDVTIIANGIMTSKALTAADLLSKEGIEARVLHLPTIKPLDEEMIIAAATETGSVVTVEDHSVLGGMGGAVAELLSEKHPTPVLRIGIPDRFGESGDDEAIYSSYGMNVENIVERTKAFLD